MTLEELQVSCLYGLLAAFGEAPESPQPALLRHLDLEIALRCAPRTLGDGFWTWLPEWLKLNPSHKREILQGRAKRFVGMAMGWRDGC